MTTPRPDETGTSQNSSYRDTRSRSLQRMVRRFCECCGGRGWYPWGATDAPEQKQCDACAGTGIIEVDMSCGDCDPCLAGQRCALDWNDGAMPRWAYQCAVDRYKETGSEKDHAAMLEAFAKLSASEAPNDESSDLRPVGARKSEQREPQVRCDDWLGEPRAEFQNQHTNMMHYVAGFMFDHSRQRVALIRKQKPAWQRGKLNGIGGKVEDGENVFDAMVRGFAEETGYETTVEQWEQFMRMAGENDGGLGAFRVDFFATVGDLSMVRTMESEPVEIVWLKDVSAVRADMIENLPWLIPLALDYLHDGRPGFVEAHYSSGLAGGGGWGVPCKGESKSGAGSQNEPAMKKELAAHVAKLVITSDNIGDIRRSLFMPFSCDWNGWVRELTAERENCEAGGGGGFSSSQTPDEEKLPNDGSERRP